MLGLKGNVRFDHNKNKQTIAQAVSNSKDKLLSEIVLSVEDLDPLELFGQNNSKLNLFRKAFPDVIVTSRGNQLKLSGQKKFAQGAKDKFELMMKILREQHALPIETVEDLLSGTHTFDSDSGDTSNGSDHVILYSRTGKPIRAKTRNQKKMVKAADTHDVVFAVGPAGTGKTYTAVALAVRALKNSLVKKIILTRPAVEAGENLGFLPGDLKEKIDPYLRPLYDALDDMIQIDKLNYFMQNRIIEVAPLAYMRGRTLDNAFIILDEAQNATVGQIKMFLTRLGPSAKCMITGDLSQIDLPYSVHSGLKKAINLLGNLEGIATVRLTADDVVRHKLVKDIIIAFEKDSAKRRGDELRADEEE
ncbi:MAG TPA: PhoH family protein [Saprospiraceae bacterium]|nr:PhoH family protein [Saprospiraceae bacterium]